MAKPLCRKIALESKGDDCFIKHGGTDDRRNLEAACYRCNEFKGAKTEAIDPEAQKLLPLFNPRVDR
ncbi:MAG: HNH endonuclease [Cyanobacteria bacterium J06638_6]